jgi:hypothetical protein
VEPDYLPDSEVFYFQPCLYPVNNVVSRPPGGSSIGKCHENEVP